MFQVVSQLLTGRQTTLPPQQHTPSSAAAQFLSPNLKVNEGKLERKILHVATRLISALPHLCAGSGDKIQLQDSPVMSVRGGISSVFSQSDTYESFKDKLTPNVTSVSSQEPAELWCYSQQLAVSNQ